MPRTVSTQRLGVGLERPADAVLDLLGRVRLGEALAKKNSRKSAVVAQPVVAVVLRPALVGVERVVERQRLAFGVAGARARTAGRCTTTPSTRSGCSAASDRRPQRAARQRRPGPRARCRSRPSPPARRRRTRRLRSASASGGPVRAAVAAAVEREDPEVAGQVRDLRLPEARVDDRPGRQQQHRRLAVAVAPPRRRARRRARRSPRRRGSGRGSARARRRPRVRRARGRRHLVDASPVTDAPRTRG